MPGKTKVGKRKYSALKRGKSVKALCLIRTDKGLIQEGWIGTVIETSRGSYVWIEWPDLNATVRVSRDTIEVIPKPF